MSGWYSGRPAGRPANVGRWFVVSHAPPGPEGQGAPEPGSQPPSLDSGKNKSRTPEEAENGRYDCRVVYQNMEVEAEDGTTAPFRCGSWDCYCCAYRMRCNLVEEIDRVTDERPEMRRLLTLTLDPERAPRSQEERHEFLTDRWNALRTELNDRYPGFSYIWVREEQENGMPHLHVLIDRFVPQGEVSRMWSRLGAGEIVDLRQVNARNAAHYIGKYLTKEAMTGLPDGARRYGSSQDIELAVRGPNDSDDEREWTLMMDDYTTVAPDRDEPLRRAVTRTDMAIQREWGGFVPPPDRGL